MLIEKTVSFEEKKAFQRETAACSIKCENEEVNKKCVRDAETFRRCRKHPPNAGNLEGLEQIRLATSFKMQNQKIFKTNSKN